MRHCKTILIFLTFLLCSGCARHATYLQGGTVIVIEEPVEVVASVPDATGTLQPHTKVTLPAGSEVKYGKAK